MVKINVKESVENALKYKLYGQDAQFKASSTSIEFLCDAVMGLVERLDKFEDLAKNSIGSNKTEILKLKEKKK